MAQFTKIYECTGVGDGGGGKTLHEIPERYRGEKMRKKR